jgi:hypothetical protein
MFFKSRGIYRPCNISTSNPIIYNFDVMKTVINILFVYIPFGFCIFFQAILLLALYGDETGVAPVAKWCFPFIAVAGIVLHFVKRRKHEN